MKDTNKEMMELERKTPETVNPFQMMRRFTRDMERLFENFNGFTFPTFFKSDFMPFRTEFENIQWMSQMEVLQNNGQFMVRVDLPGLTKDDVKVEVTKELLTISGTRNEEKEEKREGFYRTERNYGSFFRQVPLPEGATIENATATFRDGVLEITVPAKKIETPTRKLEIKEPTREKSAKATA